MKTIVAIACVSALLCVSIAEAAERIRPVPHGMTQSEYEKIIGWRDSLTAAENRLVDTHFKEHRAISARPDMTNAVLGAATSRPKAFRSRSLPT